ncbi:MAG: HEAT repeat domain-containing protein [Candidatus Acidulodesulfobacterium ferriphilum]|uniref:HEAT repeat domain-containing protein n=1 Tax=Candidatus Acidulodesulfobacterium ferriphilum TaxID=2597223 RepID=A0A519BB57_9DELT|nr:MAG: HEAT repeat domain-containing protein [Candidatus Acidulodesulfobacterium ferriphilum]
MNKQDKQRDLLFADNVDVVRNAIDNIAKYGTIKDKKLIVDLLGSSSPGIVEFAENTIIKLQEKGLIKKLFEISASSGSGIKIRSNSFDVIKQIAMKNGNFLTEYFNKSKGKYNRIISELIRYGNFIPNDYPKRILVKLSKDKDEITRANAVESIGILKLKLDGVLIKALDDTFFVSSSAIFSIGEIRLKRAFPRLKELFLKSRDRVVRNIIVDSLAKIGGNEILDFLLNLLGKNNRYTIDKIYILKSLYKIYTADNRKKSGTKESLLQKISNLNLRISISSIEEYEEKEAIDSILCYFSLLNHKKSEKMFKFLFEYYVKTENIDELEYLYIKNILKKIARPKYIMNYIKSLKPSSDFNKYDLLINVLSEISPRDIINLLDFFKDKKLFLEAKISSLIYACSVFSDKNFSYKTAFYDIILYYLSDGNGNVRKSAINLSRCSKSGIYIDKLFTFLLKENLPDVTSAFINTISNLLSFKRNKKYFYFFADNLSLKNDKIIEYSLKILEEAKLSLTDNDISDLYSKFANFKYVKSIPLKRLLARVLRKYDLAKYKEAMSFLLDESDEEIKFNYLNSLFISGVKDLKLYLDVLSSAGNFSDEFKYKIVELIEKLGDPKSFDFLVFMLNKEKSKMVKIAILSAIHIIDKEKAANIIKKYNSSKDKDLRSYSLELIQ